ncbi:accessory gene regulator ArgB-like protein [Salipaludibacillus sp. HK11]|uniref:accessory gene regulator ArgB-like protein n=1 Tax=Salipaludibacillus sp. HK11 TaxID=3394320 RepID=UPI0039FCA39E
MVIDKLAKITAIRIKEANPEETEPLDVLIFGFTVIYNLIITWILIFLLGWLLGIFWLTIQVALSFMFMRMLTGGAHLQQSFACSLVTVVLICSVVFLPSSSMFIYAYFSLSLILLSIFAPFYERHQLVHSKQWEQKKKRFAMLWVIFSLFIYVLTDEVGFVLGVLLQAVMLTPPGIVFTHALNSFSQKGGELDEKNS